MTLGRDMTTNGPRPWNGYPGRSGDGAYGKNKVIARIKGGLGNQLFCYSAARRLAIVNNAELLIDDRSGFERDLTYRRRYALNHFDIAGRVATPSERCSPFERYRREFKKYTCRRQPFERRSYIEPETRSFEPRLLSLRFQGARYLDGIWASESYFKDIEPIIRRDLAIKPPVDEANRMMAAQIVGCEHSVAVHVRWYSGARAENDNIAGDYYERALARARAQLEQPHFFIFSDDPAAAAARLSLRGRSYTLVAHNVAGDSAYADLWLMSKCRHFITANSTFSWWGAWLSRYADKLIITPDPELFDEQNPWRCGGLLPDGWTRL
jgi:hypothetical protein